MKNKITATDIMVREWRGHLTQPCRLRLFRAKTLPDRAVLCHGVFSPSVRVPSGRHPDGDRLPLRATGTDERSGRLQLAEAHQLAALLIPEMQTERLQAAPQGDGGYALKQGI